MNKVLARNKVTVLENTNPGEPVRIELPDMYRGERMFVEVSTSGFLKLTVERADKPKEKEFVGFIYHSTYKVELDDCYPELVNTPARFLVLENRDKLSMDVYVRVTCAR